MYFGDNGLAVEKKTIYNNLNYVDCSLHLYFQEICYSRTIFFLCVKHTYINIYVVSTTRSRMLQRFSTFYDILYSRIFKKIRRSIGNSLVERLTSIHVLQVGSIL